MKNGAKRIGCLIGCLVMATGTLFSGCAENVAPDGNYSYVNPPSIEKDYYIPTLTDGVNIDGEKDEKYGETPVSRLYFNNVVGERYLDTWLYYGDDGLYSYSYVKDTEVYFEPTRAIYYNSSVELFFQTDTHSSITRKSLQWRVSCGGTFVKLCGVTSASTYVSSKFDGLCAVKTYGEINSGESEGYSVELFMPWYELLEADELESFDKDTASILFMPAYNRVFNANSGNEIRKRTVPICSFQATPYTWVKTTLNENGEATGYVAEGSVFGTYDGVYRTHFPFDASEDDGTENAKLKMTTYKSSGAYAFVKSDYAASGETEDGNSYMEVTVKNIGGVSTSGRIGLMTYFNRNRVLIYTKGPKSSGADVRITIAQRNSPNTAWDWSGANEYIIDKKGANYLTEVKFAAYRSGDKLYYFVNDELYYTNDTSKESVGSNDMYFHSISEYDSCFFVVYASYASATFEKYSTLNGAAATEKFNSLVNDK